MAEEEEEEVKVAQSHPTLATLAAMDDANLCLVFGLDRQLENIKKYLTDMTALTGTARDYAERELASRLTPHVSDDSLKWIIDDAHREAVREKKSAMQVLNDECPCRF